MSTPSDFFKYRGGQLHAENVPLDQIADEVGTPVYVYSQAAFLTQLEDFQRGLKSIDHLVCFAVKACSNLSILRFLAQAGAGMDLVSGGELFRAAQAGVEPGKIVFSGVGKTPTEMAQALERGIFSFNVESSSELDVLNEVAIKLGRSAPVLLRFNPDVDAKTHPYISTGLKKNKFGLNRAEVIQIAKNIGSFEAIELCGISIHIGSQLTSLKPLDAAFLKTRELMLELNHILGHPLAVLDLGGGLGIQYQNEKTCSIRDYTRLIVKHFGQSIRKKQPLKIVIEPGRTIAGNSGVLLTEALYRKSRGKRDFLIVDAGMNDLLRPALYSSYHSIVPVTERTTRPLNTKKTTSLVGPVCETADFFALDRAFSTAVMPGDRVAILSSGAYGFTMSSNYNSRPRPAEVLVDGSSYRVIRKRERLADLIRGELSGELSGEPREDIR